VGVGGKDAGRTPPLWITGYVVAAAVDGVEVLLDFSDGPDLSDDADFSDDPDFSAPPESEPDSVFAAPLVALLAASRLSVR
jgi:hypothetical protein